MDTAILLIVLIVLILVLIGAVAFMLLRKPSAPALPADLATPLQNLTTSILQGHSHTAVLTEKLHHIESIVPAINNIQIELKGLAERTSKVEGVQGQVNAALIKVGTGLTQTGTMTQSLLETTSTIRNELARAKTELTALAERTSKIDGNQNQFNHGMIALGNQLTETDAVTKGLVQAATAIRDDIALTKNDITQIHTQAKTRLETEYRTSESIRRLEAVLAGTQSKGAAGENILEAVFSKLPTEWQVRDFKVNGCPCEFGLRLPNNLVLPIDSKWAATNLLEQFVASEDVAEQQKLKAQIESAVLSKAREVRKYIDPNLTVNFGVAAVPDAIYELCSASQCDAMKINVVLIPYSMFIPYLMLVFQTVLKTSQNIDLEKLDRELKSINESLTSLQEEIEGRFSKAITMLTNSRGDMSAHLGKINSRLTSLQINETGTVKADSSNSAQLEFAQVSE